MGFDCVSGSCVANAEMVAYLQQFYQLACMAVGAIMGIGAGITIAAFWRYLS